MSRTIQEQNPGDPTLLPQRQLLNGGQGRRETATKGKPEMPEHHHPELRCIKSGQRTGWTATEKNRETATLVPHGLTDVSTKCVWTSSVAACCHPSPGMPIWWCSTCGASARNPAATCDQAGAGNPTRINSSLAIDAATLWNPPS